MAASSSISTSVAALEGGFCARPAAFPSATMENVSRQLMGPIPDQVPAHMNIKFNKSRLEGKMIQVSTVDNTVKELDEFTSETMVSKHTGEFGSICFVVRRPG